MYGDCVADYLSLVPLSIRFHHHHYYYELRKNFVSIEQRCRYIYVWLLFKMQLCTRDKECIECEVHIFVWNEWKRANNKWINIANKWLIYFIANCIAMGCVAHGESRECKLSLSRRKFFYNNTINISITIEFPSFFLAWMLHV